MLYKMMWDEERQKLIKVTPEEYYKHHPIEKQCQPQGWNDRSVSKSQRQSPPLCDDSHGLYDEMGKIDRQAQKAIDEAFPDADSSDKANMLYELFGGK